MTVLSDSMLIDPREDKLPAWARDQLGRLRRRVTDAESRAEEARLATNPDETNTFFEYTYGNRIGLPKDCSVSFLLDGTDNTRMDVGMQIERSLDYKQMHTLRISGWHGGLLVIPQASNVVHIGLRP